MTQTRLIRALLLFLGAIMLLSYAWQLLVPRAQYVNSNPAPGAVLTAPPRSVAVSLSSELASESRIDVSSTITLSPSGEIVHGDGKRFTARGPDSGDPDKRTLRVDLDPALPHGLYWVRWTAVAARGRAERSGRLCFAVGMSIPEHITRDMPGALSERNFQERRYRAVLLSGVLFVALGLFLPRLSVRT